MTDRDMIMMLIALCAAVFFVTSAGASTAPFLNLIAGDLATTLPAVAHLFSIQALTWGIASLIASVISAVSAVAPSWVSFTPSFPNMSRPAFAAAP